MFIDEATIQVQAGDGGNGCMAFRREKYIPRGGPSGGDGGHGGDVIVRATGNVRTLIDCSHRRHYKAGRGAHGQGDNKTGSDGADVVIKVPVGTQIRHAQSHELIADLVYADQQVVVARGGEGGSGNRRFVSATRQAPRFAQAGDWGEEHTLQLTLKILADVALIGFPNAGKSTFIAASSAAKPKIANYPFTTLTPNLGVVKLDATTQMVLADIPGLIRGAHKGVGLGDQFLKHIERAPVFIHVLDVMSYLEMSLWRQFMAVNRELKMWNKELADRPQVVAINKMDAVASDPETMQAIEALESKLEARGCRVFRISAATGEGVKALLWEVATLVKEKMPQEDAPQQPVIMHQYAAPPKALQATKIGPLAEGGNEWQVSSSELENLIRRFDISNTDAALYVHHEMQKRGHSETLARCGVRPGDLIHVGEAEFVFE